MTKWTKQVFKWPPPPHPPPAAWLIPLSNTVTAHVVDNVFYLHKSSCWFIHWIHWRVFYLCVRNKHRTIRKQNAKGRTTWEKNNKYYSQGLHSHLMERRLECSPTKAVEWSGNKDNSNKSCAWLLRCKWIFLRLVAKQDGPVYYPQLLRWRVQGGCGRWTDNSSLIPPVSDMPEIGNHRRCSSVRLPFSSFTTIPTMQCWTQGCLRWARNGTTCVFSINILKPLC